MRSVAESQKTVFQSRYLLPAETCVSIARLSWACQIVRCHRSEPGPGDGCCHVTHEAPRRQIETKEPSDSRIKAAKAVNLKWFQIFSIIGELQVLLSTQFQFNWSKKASVPDLFWRNYPPWGVRGDDSWKLASHPTLRVGLLFHLCSSLDDSEMTLSKDDKKQN